jgi:AraC-like DNA-binding protein
MSSTSVSLTVANFMQANYMEKISIDDLESLTGVSRFTILRAFHRHFGATPMRWLWRYRVEQGAKLLHDQPAWSCSDIAYYCGFETPSHFTRRFRAVYGRPPGYFRQNKCRVQSLVFEHDELNTLLAH